MVRARPTEAEGWQDAGTPAPNPDSLLQTFAREQLNVFPTSATHCPLLVVNVAHFIHPDGVHIPACELTEPRRTVAHNGALEPHRREARLCPQPSAATSGGLAVKVELSSTSIYGYILGSASLWGHLSCLSVRGLVSQAGGSQVRVTGGTPEGLLEH